ncbi:MAG TPA: glycosyltransferase family 2 protein [Pyrinomonadaceae bacterium]
MSEVEPAWPKISVVTISYNQGKFLEDTIKSVVSQNYPNLEYIIIDGGSTDNSPEIIKRFSNQLSFWCSEPDAGPAGGLNKGFRHVTGDILAFLNADDLFLPGTLKRAVELFRRHPTADVVFGDGYLTDSAGELRKPTYSDDWNLWRLAYGTCVIVQPATFFTRAIFEKTKGFNEHYRAFWDASLWVDMALAGAKFHHEKEFLAVFRLHNLSITGSGREDKEESRVEDELFERIVGRPRRASDKLLSWVLRVVKFLGHPRWSLNYKLFLRSIQRGDRLG